MPELTKRTILMLKTSHPDKLRRFERAKPNELWQTDLFTFVLKKQNRRVYLVAFMDDHSRFLVSYGLHASCSNGSAFTSAEFQALCARWQVVLLYSPPRRPQYNGALERSNAKLKTYTQLDAELMGYLYRWTGATWSARYGWPTRSADPGTT